MSKQTRYHYNTYNRETESYAALNGKYKHYCPDWDFMAIDETCPEWDACLCYNKETLECST